MSAAELQALPVSGRRWQDFVLDNTPTSTTPAGGQGEISLRGAGQSRRRRGGWVEHAAWPLADNAPGQGSRDGAEWVRARTGRHGAGGRRAWIAVSEAAIRTVETVAGNVEAAADAGAPAGA